MTAVRDDLLRSRGQGDLYAFIDGSYRYLDEVGGDPQIVMATLQSLAQLHLGDLAREMLETRAEVRDLEVDVDELRTLLDRIPSGRHSWDTTAAIFEGNLAALRSGQPHLVDAEDRMRSALEAVRLYRSSTGCWHLAEVRDDRVAGWRPTFTNDSAADQFDLQQTARDHVPLVIGFAPNALIDRTIATTRARPGDRETPVYVVDPDWTRLAAWLHLADRTEALLDPRIALFAGPSAFDDYEDRLRRHDDLPLHSAILSTGATESHQQLAHDVEARIAEHRARRAEALDTEAHAMCAARTSADWSTRLVPGAAVLGFTSRHTTMLQHSMRDIGDVFNAIDFRFDRVMERTPFSRHTPSNFLERVVADDPALVVLLNHLRPDSLSHELTPVLTWIQDPNVEILSTEGARRFGPNDFLAGYYARQCVETYGYPTERVFPIGFVPVSTRAFHDAPLSDEESSRFTCDVAYVGHLHQTEEALIDETRAAVPDTLRPFVDRIASTVRARFDAGDHLDQSAAETLVTDEQARLGITLPDEARRTFGHFLAHRLFDIRFRLCTMEWAADWARRTGRSLRLYGRGWSEHPDFAEFAAGPVEHGAELRAAYRGAKLIIQTIPSGFAHQRTFEAICSGANVLLRYCPANFAGLTMGEFARRHGDGAGVERSVYRQGFRGLDRFTFDGEERFGQIADRLLGDQATADTLQAELRALVDEHFTYDAVVPKLVAFMRDALAGSGNPR